jgi:hypothetical protein
MAPNFRLYCAKPRLQLKTPERLRNEMVDMVFIACATYFDGILSHERKVNDIYGQAMFLLRIVFVSQEK